MGREVHNALCCRTLAIVRAVSHAGVCLCEGRCRASLAWYML